MGPLLRRVVHILGIGLVAMFALASSAVADGVYIPQRAYPTLPTIPVQRAIIIHRNGVETLIVESAFQSKSPDVAWILPLPAVPGNLQLTEAGAISSTAYSLRPKIVHDLYNQVSFTQAITLVTLPLALVLILIRNRIARYTTFLCLLAPVSCSMLLGSLGKAGSDIASAALPGLSILSSQRLGDADCTVLNATSPDVLDTWLTGQGLRPLDTAAKPIVADYIARRWCFVVGVLHNSASELSVPRPLIATFPAAAPVFPMKLTALANSTTHVELCVIAADQAVAPGFQCVIADTFRNQPAQPDSDSFPALGAYYSATRTGTALGHPDIVPLLWDNCTATKLIADLPPARMDQDITIQFRSLRPQRQTLYSSLTRGQIAIAMIYIGATIFFFLAAVFLRGRRKPAPWQFKTLAAFVPSVLVITAAVWLALPTVPVYVGSRGAQYELEDMPQSAADKVMLYGDMTPQQILAIPQLLVDEKKNFGPELLNNPFTGQPIRVECSPGNFAMRTVGDKTYFCIYDENGIERRILVH
jgi:hypothetical protein